MWVHTNAEFLTIETICAISGFFLGYVTGRMGIIIEIKRLQNGRKKTNVSKMQNKNI